MKNRFVSFLLFFLMLFYPIVVFAGPGGKIARAVAETFWGKILIGILIILFLPYIIYILVKQDRAKKRVFNELKVVAITNPAFDWILIRDRILDCFYRVHAAWEKSDVSEASDWMTDWYWQNQQMTFLDRWHRYGLVNVCQIDIISSIKPILFVFRSNNGRLGEGSMLAILIDAVMTDYLERKSDGQLVEGSRKKKKVERIWSFVFENNKWLVSNIDEGSNSLEYIEMMKTVPAIEDALDQYGTSVAAKRKA